MGSREEPQPLRRSGSAAVAEHPLLAEVRRRRPDIDLILLPPERSAAVRADAPMLSETEVRAEADRLSAAWRLLAAVIEASGESLAPSIAWREQSGEHVLVVQQALRAIGQAAGADVLRSAAVRLDEFDWRFVVGARRSMPVLRAVDDVDDPHLLLHAEAGPGATVLTLRTRPMNVADAVRSRIAEEARTWQ